MKMSRSSSSLFMQQQQRPDATTLAGAAGDEDEDARGCRSLNANGSMMKTTFLQPPPTSPLRTSTVSPARMCVVLGSAPREMTQVYSSQSAYSLACLPRVAATTPADEEAAAAASFPHAALGSARSRNGLMESTNELLPPECREPVPSAVRASARPRQALGGLHLMTCFRSSGEVGLQTESSGSTALLAPPLPLSLTKRPGTLKKPTAAGTVLRWPLDSTMAWPWLGRLAVAVLPSAQEDEIARCPSSTGRIARGSRRGVTGVGGRAAGLLVGPGPGHGGLLLKVKERAKRY
uniref:Uncharacterized protein n=1 Tax=Zea mays TaxID=4577 RepID=C4J0V2_MAIZE|nr:unknown [Zea mays]